MKTKSKVLFKQIGIWILFIIGYILSSTLFTIATGYKFGYLIFLLVFWLAEKCCDKVKEKAKYNMTEEEIKAEEEKSDLGVLIFGVITSIAIIVFLICIFNNWI